MRVIHDDDFLAFHDIVDRPDRIFTYSYSGALNHIDLPFNNITLRGASNIGDILFEGIPLRNDVGGACSYGGRLGGLHLFRPNHGGMICIAPFRDPTNPGDLGDAALEESGSVIYQRGSTIWRSFEGSPEHPVIISGGPRLIKIIDLSAANLPAPISGTVQNPLPIVTGPIPAGILQIYPVGGSRVLLGHLPCDVP
jgi:hypothetical protein